MINLSNAYVTKALMKIKAMGNDLKHFVSRLTHLEELVEDLKMVMQGHEFKYVTDDDISYTKIVPAKAQKFASLDKVGGMSRKGYQLLPLENVTSNGVECVLNNDGTMTFNGTLTSDRIGIFRNIILPLNGEYNFTLKKISGDGNINALAIKDSSYENIINQGLGYSVNYTISNKTATEVIVYSDINTVFNNFVCKIMLVTGNEEKPSEKYTPNLIDASCDDVISYGVNLLNPNAEGVTQNKILKDDGTLSTDVESYVSDYIKVIPNKEITSHLNKPWNALCLGFYDKDKNLISAHRHDGVKDKTYTIPSNAYYLRETVDKSDTNAFITYSDSLVYTPYREPIHYQQQPFSFNDGKMLGINSDCYDYREYIGDGKAIDHSRVGVVDMASLNWLKFNGSDTFGTSYYYVQKNDVKVFTPYVISNILCAKYTTSNKDSFVNSDKVIQCSDNYFRLRDLSCESVSELKQAMQGVMLYYEKATETTQEFEFEDNFIEVEVGGTIEFHHEAHDNGYEVDVPSEVTYMISLLEDSTNE